MPYLFIILALSVSSFSKTTFFKVIENGTKVEISSLQKEIASQSVSTTQQAYLGALQMKASNFEKTPAEKLALFKKGKELLEKSIKSEPSNAEFRFLRLIIQENAPKVLKYNQEIKTDAAFIESNISKLPKDVKAAVLDYSKNSANLKI